MNATLMQQTPHHDGASTSAGSTARGLLLVISGPSGVGKTTIAHRLVDRLGALFSVSMTTRPPAPTDREGKDYYFVSPHRFEQAIASGELLEWAKVFGNYYGTPRSPVEQQLAGGRDVVLEIDVNGAIQVKQAFPDALTIFILPPSEEELLRRLRARGREADDVIQRRFGEAKKEIALAHQSSAYDHFLVNEQLDDVINQAHDIICRRKSAQKYR